MSALLAGLIGHPVAHSISPDFQQAAFAALNIDARYERWDVDERDLVEAVGRLRSAPFLGANVTLPYKEAVIPLLDRIEPLARRAGAVNTIVREEAGLRGLNTDVGGFRRALTEAGGFHAAGVRAVVLGAGGAARAVVLALQQAEAASVAVANRTPARAELLVASLRSPGGPRLTSVPWEQAVGPALEAIDLLVNCTTIGLAGSEHAATTPIGVQFLQATTFVCDIVANPRVTPLLEQALARGCRCLGGLAMLVYQGAESFEHWTGQPAPIRVMFAAAEAAMARAAGR